MAKSKKVQAKTKKKPQLKAKAPVKSKAAVKAKPKNEAKKSSPSKPAKTSFQPINDRVLIQRSEFSKQTAGGLFIPDSVGEAPNEGTVVGVGPGSKTKKGKIQPTSVKVGNKVLFSKYSGNEIKIDGQEFIILRENEILGVLETE